jgi:hypothetical protein
VTQPPSTPQPPTPAPATPPPPTAAAQAGAPGAPPPATLPPQATAPGTPPPATAAAQATAIGTPPPTSAPATPLPPTQALPPTSAPAPLVDETFAANAAGWPDATTSSAFWDSSGYHLVPRIAGQHVAITAPTAPQLADGAVSGLFRKLAGPAGGGYGLILRAQTPLDGSTQGGRYYVFEVGDKGEVGAWRREQTQWVDLQAWQSSEAVHPGIAENRLEVRAAGSQFTFSVNDTPVAQVTDASLPSGAVGVFAGGDGNQVQVERFTVSNQ